MTFDCMTPDELAAWREADDRVARQVGYHVQKPCVDCPLSFRLAEIAAGRCYRIPPTSDRRTYSRDWMRAYRARQAA